jgi:drug/metabolite transporter (DMT)-like permease
MAAVWMLFASFMFAAMGAGVKLASSLYSTSEIVLYRGIIGSLLLLPMVRLQGGTLRTPFPREHLWRSIVGVISLWMWFYAISRLPLATAVTLNYMAPIWLSAWMLLTGWWHGKGIPEWPLVLAVALSFFGVTLVLQPAAQSNQWLGGIIAIGSSVVAAMAYMQVRKLGQMGEPEYRVVFYFSLTMALAGLVVANLQYTGIIFSSVWGMVLWGDVFDWHVWLGMGIILASGLAATFYNTMRTARGAVVKDTDPIASEL